MDIAITYFTFVILSLIWFYTDRKGTSVPIFVFPTESQSFNDIETS